MQELGESGGILGNFQECGRLRMVRAVFFETMFPGAQSFLEMMISHGKRLMKTIFLAVPILLAISNLGHCKSPAVQVKVTVVTAEILAGQRIEATVQVTNADTFFDLQLPPTNYAQFDELLTADNPQLKISGIGIQTFGILGKSTPLITLEPGRSLSKQITLSTTEQKSSPIKFRIGFKATPNSAPIWSKPVTVRIKKDQNLPVKIDASLKDNYIYRSNVLAGLYPGKDAVVHVRLINTSSAPQNIGSPDEPYSLVIDTPAIKFTSDLVHRITQFVPLRYREITLKPKEIFEEDRGLTYLGEDLNPKPISFRVGFKRIGGVSIWSNPLTVTIVNLTHSMSRQATPPLDGIVKTYYDGGAPKEECTYKGGKLNGPYKSYLANGQRWQELNYADNLLDGLEKQYDGTGKLIVGQYFSHNHLLRGIFYNKDGSIHGDLKYGELQGGDYFPLQIPCARDDSDQDFLNKSRRCNSLGK